MTFSIWIPTQPATPAHDPWFEPLPRTQRRPTAPPPTAEVVREAPAPAPKATPAPRTTLTLATPRAVPATTTRVVEVVDVTIRKTAYEIALEKMAAEQAAAAEAHKLAAVTHKPKTSRKRLKEAKAAQHAKRERGPEKGPQGSMLTRRGVCKNVPYDKLALVNTL